MKIVFNAERVRIVSNPIERTYFDLFVHDSKTGFFGIEETTKYSKYYIEFENMSKLYFFLEWLIFTKNSYSYSYDVILFRKKLLKLIIENQELLEKRKKQH